MLFELTDEARATVDKNIEAVARKEDTHIIAENRLLRASEVTKDITPPEWLIKPFIPEEGILELFGASGSYKSFIVIDMLFCISAGIEYHGSKTKRGTAIYIAGEGLNGAKRRLRALELHYKINDYDLYILPIPSNLMEAKEIETLSEEIKAIAPNGSSIVMFDTLHRNSAGSRENSADDFAVILGHIDTYLRPVSKVTGWVHHSGLADDNRSRGTTARYAACDTVIKISKPSELRAVMECTKQKDSDPFLRTPFKMEKIGIGVEDEDGNEVISLIPIRVESEAEKPKSKIKQEHRELVDCLRLAISKKGRALSDEVKEREHIIEGRCLSVPEWKIEARKIIISNGGEDIKKQTDAKNKAFYRAKKILVEVGQIGEFDDDVWIASDCKKDFWHTSTKEEIE